MTRARVRCSSVRTTSCRGKRSTLHGATLAGEDCSTALDDATVWERRVPASLPRAMGGRNGEDARASPQGPLDVVLAADATARTSALDRARDICAASRRGRSPPSARFGQFPAGAFFPSSPESEPALPAGRRLAASAAPLYLPTTVIIARGALHLKTHRLLRRPNELPACLARSPSKRSAQRALAQRSRRSKLLPGAGLASGRAQRRHERKVVC